MNTPQSARRTDPSTSHEAAARLDTANGNRTVLEVVKSFGAAGCIHDDVVKVLKDIPATSISPRYAVLARQGLIRFPGGKRLSSYNRNQRVMVAN